MYSTKGISAATSITDLRSKTTQILDSLDESPTMVIQKNNAPYGILVSPKRFQELFEAEEKLKAQKG